MVDCKAIGHKAESLATKDHESHGFRCIELNWTMRGGEIDTIFIDDVSEVILIVKVKVVDSMVDDIIGYVTSYKMRHLSKSIRSYCLSCSPEYIDMDIRIDIVFVRNNHIYERYESITLQ